MPPTTPRCARVRAPLWSFFAASCSVLFSRVVSPRIKRFWFAVFDLPTLLLVAHVLPFVSITCTYERWVTWVARRIRELRVTFGDEGDKFRDGKEGEMLQAPASPLPLRGDELVVAEPGGLLAQSPSPVSRH